MGNTDLTDLVGAAIGPGLDRAPTGISGLDQITGGGLPRGRVTLVAGSAGAGKTLLGLQFLVAGAREYGEPGVLLTFEESAAKVAANVRSLGFDLDELQRDGLLAVLSFRVEPTEIVAAGDFDLEPLFLTLDDVIKRVGAKRVVLDTIEVLFGAFGADPHRAGRAQPPDALARGAGRHRHRDRGAGRGEYHPARDRGVRLRLRDRARPSGARGDFHPAAPGGQVPRVGARHQRVPVLHLRPGLRRAADHLDHPGLRGSRGAGLIGNPPSRPHAGRRHLPRFRRTGKRDRGHGQDLARCAHGERGLRAR